MGFNKRLLLSKIHVHNKGGNNIDITLETSNILSDPAARDFTYQCVYSFQSVTTTRPDFTTPANKGANPSSNAFTCSSPGLPNVPPLPPQTGKITSFSPAYLCKAYFGERYCNIRGALQFIKPISAFLSKGSRTGHFRDSFPSSYFHSKKK